MSACETEHTFLQNVIHQIYGLQPTVLLELLSINFFSNVIKQNNYVSPFGETVSKLRSVRSCHEMRKDKTSALVCGFPILDTSLYITLILIKYVVSGLTRFICCVSRFACSARGCTQTS